MSLTPVLLTPMSLASTLPRYSSNSPSQSTSILSVPSMRPITPMQTQRYEPIDTELFTEKKFPKGRHKTNGKLNAFMFDLAALPSGWQEYIHPDGKPYFHHAEWHVVTEVDIRDPASFKTLHDLYTTINKRWLDDSTYSDSGNFELYLAIAHTPRAQQEHCYYFIDHDNRDIFWLDDHEVEDIGAVPYSMSYELFLLQSYYGHLENFPCHHELPEDAAEFLHSALTFTCIDHLTSVATSTISPWTPERAKDFLDLLSGLEEKRAAKNGRSDPFDHIQAYRTWSISRLIGGILHARILYKHGMIDARTDRLHCRPSSPPSVLDYFIGAFTFLANITHVQQFEKVWIDDVVSEKGWEDLLDSLCTQWSDSNLLATVVLSANMAFLALLEPSLPKAAITTSVISTFCSMGSIVIGLHHLWRLRGKGKFSEEVGVHFKRAVNLTGNLRLLSFFFSLPLALLFWSIVIFACSVSIYAFQATNYFVSIIPPLAIGSAVAAVLFFWQLVFV